MVGLYTSQHYSMLNPRLEETVKKLGHGDRVIVEHEVGNRIHVSEGYVTEVNGGFLTLAPNLDSGLANRLAQMLGRLRPLYYANLENITVVDRANGK
ncbi:MAG: hypothetical protein WCV90_01145 [Candidatus Woesearchaeota archaeon]